jgi:hypothetical protein
MARGISLHIGVNRLNKSDYPLDPPNPDYPDGWDGPLAACENDAEEMCALAKRQGFETLSILKTADATVENVTKAVKKAAKELSAGDIFFISFAGHGGMLPDKSKDERELTPGDMHDESWCLYDRQFRDDEQYALYSEFDAGVRIVILSDSCHSGTASRGPGDPEPTKLTPAENKKIFGTEAPASRSMRGSDALPIYTARKKDYDDFERKVGKVDVKADILLISACQDDQEAADGPFNGKFTATVLDVWGDGFDGSYIELHKRIKESLEAEFAAILEARGGPGSGARGGPGSNEVPKPPQIPNFFAPQVRNKDFPEQPAFKI